MSGTGKKIDGISKKKDCGKVGRWKKSVINHMFWCAATTDDNDDGDIREAKWLSITNHIKNKHRGHGNQLFSKCVHGKLVGCDRKKKWLDAGLSKTIILISYFTFQ